MLGVRIPIDIRPDSMGQVMPGHGGMSVVPESPRFLPLHFRPESLGGVGRVPVFSIEQTGLGQALVFRPDRRKPERHGYVEPSVAMTVENYQLALCLTAPLWKEYQ